MSFPSAHPRDPLHGITLEAILNHLVARHGWDEMGVRIRSRCFLNDSRVGGAGVSNRLTIGAGGRMTCRECDCNSGGGFP